MDDLRDDNNRTDKKANNSKDQVLVLSPTLFEDGTIDEVAGMFFLRFQFQGSRPIPVNV